MLLKSFIITENDSNQRLDKFITKTIPNLPKSMMYKYIRIKRIKVNGKRAQISTNLEIGDTVDMFINDEFFVKEEKRYDFINSSKKIDIIFEDDNIMLLNKPVGLLCHPDDKEYVDTLISRVKRYLYEKGEYDPGEENSFTPALVNRIDRNTSGIVIAAKNAQSLRILNQKMKDREIHKYYKCIIHGCPQKKQSILEGYIFKDEKKNKVYIQNKSNEKNKSIRTKYQVLATKNNLSFVEIDLLTGRTHQIRSHLASIGHPLLGDGKYGTNKLNKEKGYKKQCLCSYKLVFDFETDSGILEYLNGKIFEIQDIWFEKEFFNETL